MSSDEELAVATNLPRLVGNTGELPPETAPGRGGSVWQLKPATRDLDANVITLLAGDAIETHNGPSLDVLIHVLAGSGTLTTEASEVALCVGDLVWLPPRSQRRFQAGPDGLTYFSVHQRKPSLFISNGPADS
jgi:quercetin dioxygenase-like cupin family protein